VDTSYIQYVRAIQLTRENVSKVQDWASHSGFNGTQFFGWGRNKGLLVSHIGCIYGALAFPGDWIVEVRPLNYVVVSNEDFKRDFCLS